MWQTPGRLVPMSYDPSCVIALNAKATEPKLEPEKPLQGPSVVDKIMDTLKRQARVEDKNKFIFGDCDDLIAQGILRNTWEYWDEHKFYVKVDPNLDLTIAFRPAKDHHLKWLNAKTRRQNWQRNNPGVDRRLYKE